MTKILRNLQCLLLGLKDTLHSTVGSLRTQTYFRLSVVSAEPVTAGNTSAFAGYAVSHIVK